MNLREMVTLEHLHIEMRDVDAAENHLKKVGETTFTASISERDLNDYVQRFPPPDEEPVRIKRVVLKPGQFHAEGTRWILGRAWQFKVTSEPRLVSESHLMFDTDKMSVEGLPVPLPSSVLTWLSRHLSKGTDFSTLPFPLRIHRFTVESGRIVLEGEADVMESLNRQLTGYRAYFESSCSIRAWASARARFGVAW